MAQCGQLRGANRRKEAAFRCPATPWRQRLPGESPTAPIDRRPATKASVGTIRRVAARPALLRQRGRFGDNRHCRPAQRTRVGGWAQSAIGAARTFRSQGNRPDAKAVEYHRAIWSSVRGGVRTGFWTEKTGSLHLWPRHELAVRNSIAASTAPRHCGTIGIHRSHHEAVREKLRCARGYSLSNEREWRGSPKTLFRSAFHEYFCVVRSKPEWVTWVLKCSGLFTDQSCIF